MSMWKLRVETPLGRTLSLRVAADTTVATIKERLRELTGIPASQQSIEFSMDLDDSRHLYECTLREHRVVRLVAMPGAVPVVGDVVRTEKLPIEGQEAGDDASESGESQLGECPCPLLVFYDNGSFFVDVDPACEVAALKSRIFTRTGVRPQVQVLTTTDGARIDNEGSLRDAGVGVDGGAACVRMVQDRGRKRRRPPSAGIPRSRSMSPSQRQAAVRRRFAYNARMESEDTVYDPTTLAVPVVQPIVEVPVAHDEWAVSVKSHAGATHEMRVGPAMLVSELKDRLSQTMEAAPASSEMNLYFGAHRLTDTMALGYYGVCNNSTIFLFPSIKSRQ